MTNKRHYLLEKLTSIVRSRLLFEQLDIDNPLYQAFHVDPSKYELRLPDPDRDISGQDYLKAIILSATPQGSSSNPVLKIRIFPSYQVFEYVGETTREREKGDRVIFSNYERYEEIINGPKGPETVKRVKRYIDPSDKFGGRPEDYIIPSDAPVARDVRVRYNDAVRDGYEAVLKNERGTSTLRSIRRQDISFEDGGNVFRTLQNTSNLYSDVPPEDLRALNELFTKLYDQYTYTNDLSIGNYKAAIEQALSICKDILDRSNLKMSARNAIEVEFEKIQKDPQIPSKGKLREILKTFTELLQELARTSTGSRSSLESKVGFTYGHVKAKKPEMRVFRKSLTRFKILHRRNYGEEFSGVHTAFREAAKDFITALNKEEAIKTYYELKYPGDPGMQSKMFNNLVEKFKEQFDREAERPNPSLEVIFNAEDQLESELPELTSIEAELREIFNVDYSKFAPEEGFLKAKDMFKKVLNILNMSEEEKKRISRELNDLPTKTPQAVLTYINSQIRAAEKLIPPGKAFAQNSPEVGSIMTGRVETDSALERSEYGSILQEAIKLVKQSFNNLSHSGLSIITLQAILDACEKVDTLSDLEVLIETTVDAFDLEDVEDVWLDALRDFAKTAISSFQSHNEELRAELEADAIGGTWTTARRAQEFIEYFKKLGAGRSEGTSGIDEGYTDKEVVDACTAELNMALRGNKYIDAGVKSRYMTELVKLKSAGTTSRQFVKVDKKFTSDLNLPDHPASANKELKQALQDAYLDGLERIRDVGVMMYKNRRYKPVAPSVLVKDLANYTTYEDLVTYLIHFLGPTEIVSYTSKDITSTMLELSRYVLGHVIDQAPGFTDDSRDVFKQELERCTDLFSIEEVLNETFGSPLITSKFRKALTSSVSSLVRQKVITALDQNKKVPMSAKKIIIKEMSEAQKGENVLQVLDGFLKAITGIDQTGLQSIILAGGDVDTVRQVFMGIVARSNMSVSKKKQIYNSLYGSSWNDQSDKLPMLSVPRIQQFAANLTLASAGLHTPKQKKG